MCMSRLISFVLADASCGAREESENYKMKKNLANSGISPYYLSLIELAFSPIAPWNPCESIH